MADAAAEGVDGVDVLDDAGADDDAAPDGRLEAHARPRAQGALHVGDQAGHDGHARAGHHAQAPAEEDGEAEVEIVGAALVCVWGGLDK